jgi:hypothetical protein
MRTTDGPAEQRSRPASSARAHTSAAAPRISRPQMRPAPRARDHGRAPQRERAEPLLQPESLADHLGEEAGSEIRRVTASAAAATSGPPPNVVAWSPGWMAAATVSRRRTAPIGRPPASGLASVMRSGSTPALLVRPERSRPAESDLDLVEDERRARGVARLAQRVQEVRGNRVYSALALDRLDDHRRRRLGPDRGGQLGRVSDLHEADAGDQRAERILVGRPVGGRQRAHRATMETAAERHDLGSSPGHRTRSPTGART